MYRNPSGEQFDIVHGEQRATIVEVGGGIRTYTVAGRDVLQPYGIEHMCDGAHGVPLIPWPNRLGEGRYSFEGHDYHLPITEPEKNNAIHGLLRWRPWRVVELRRNCVAMATTIFPEPGYPFTLDVQVLYHLDDAGLTVTTTATNSGDHRAPYGCGQHPYLSTGNAKVDECVLRLEAATRILTDPVRQLPISRGDVAGTKFDFRAGRRIGSLAIDFAFTDLNRDSDGRAWVHLANPDGHVTRLWVDEAYPLIEIFTGDTLAPGRRRRGLGTEPMTCPPNAFQSGTGVVTLAPQETSTARWGVQVAPSGKRL